MKHSLSLLASLLFVYSISSYADTPVTSDIGKLSGNLAFTSNYVWRGISQTNNGPAIQGGLTYTLNNGLYANLWGSNVKFGTATLEVDPSIGYGQTLANGIGYDVGLTRYTYPKSGQTNYDYNEAHITGSYSIFNGTIAYSNNASNSGGNGTYYTAGVAYNLPATYIFNLENVNIGGSIGHYTLAPVAGKSYNDYRVSISKKLTQKVKLELAWTSTNGKNNAYPLDRDHLLATLLADL